MEASRIFYCPTSSNLLMSLSRLLCSLHPAGPRRAYVYARCVHDMLCLCTSGVFFSPRPTVLSQNLSEHRMWDKNISDSFSSCCQCKRAPSPAAAPPGAQILHSSPTELTYQHLLLLTQSHWNGTHWAHVGHHTVWAKWKAPHALMSTFSLSVELHSANTFT